MVNFLVKGHNKLAEVVLSGDGRSSGPSLYTLCLYISNVYISNVYISKKSKSLEKAGVKLTSLTVHYFAPGYRTKHFLLMIKYLTFSSLHKTRAWFITGVSFYISIFKDHYLHVTGNCYSFAIAFNKSKHCGAQLPLDEMQKQKNSTPHVKLTHISKEKDTNHLLFKDVLILLNSY